MTMDDLDDVFIDYEGRQLDGSLTPDEEKVVKALLSGVQRCDLARRTGVSQKDVSAMLSSDWLNVVLNQREEESYAAGRRLAALALPEAIALWIKVMRNDKLSWSDRMKAANNIANFAMSGEERHVLKSQLKRIEKLLAEDDSGLSELSPADQFTNIMEKYMPKVAQKRGMS